MAKKIAIIILNWNQPKLTIDTVDSILKIKPKSFSYHIYLVDNASEDNSISLFKKKYQNCKNITILETAVNLGYVGGNNFALKKALKLKFDDYLIANNDLIVDPQFLQNLYQASLKYPSSILAPKIYFAPGHEYHQNRYSKKEIGKVIWAVGGKIDWDNIYGSNIGIDEVDHGQYDHSNPQMDFISGCCLLVPHKVFKKIGLFDKKFFLYLEDSDFSQRALKAGFDLRLVPDSVIWHINSGSSKPSSSIQEYFITRNRLIFGFRYANFKTKFALFRESIKFLLSGSKWRRLAVKDFYFNNLGKGSWV